jgi:TonB family protein
VATELSDAVPLGLKEEPSSSPVKIAPSPPALDTLLPISRTPSLIASAAIGTTTGPKPTMNLTQEVDHVFQRSEVDQLPFVVSRPDPDVRVSTLGESGKRSVVLLFIVGMRGEVGKVRIVQSSDNSEFDEIIAGYVAQWVFSPAIRKGKPVRCMIQQRITVQRPQRDIFSL